MRSARFAFSLLFPVGLLACTDSIALRRRPKHRSLNSTQRDRRLLLARTLCVVRDLTCSRWVAILQTPSP